MNQLTPLDFPALDDPVIRPREAVRTRASATSPRRSSPRGAQPKAKQGLFSRGISSEDLRQVNAVNQFTARRLSGLV